MLQHKILFDFQNSPNDAYCVWNNWSADDLITRYSEHRPLWFGVDFNLALDTVVWDRQILFKDQTLWKFEDKFPPGSVDQIENSQPKGRLYAGIRGVPVGNGVPQMWFEMSRFQRPRSELTIFHRFRNLKTLILVPKWVD